MLFMVPWMLTMVARGVVSANAADTCYSDVSVACSPTTSRNLDLPTCNALYGSFRAGKQRWDRYGVSVDISQVLVKEMQAYANLHISRSYELLLSSIYFNSYQTNRAGLSKLFRKLSNDAWEKSLGLIKHIAKRGRDMDFTYNRTRFITSPRQSAIIEVHELGALAKALDIHKELAEVAFGIHREATRNREALHDSEISHYMEEEFIEGQADTIRELAGHTADVMRFMVDKHGQDMSLALHLFDNYLAKTV